MNSQKQQDQQFLASLTLASSLQPLLRFHFSFSANLLIFNCIALWVADDWWNIFIHSFLNSPLSFCYWHFHLDCRAVTYPRSNKFRSTIDFSCWLFHSLAHTYNTYTQNVWIGRKYFNWINRIWSDKMFYLFFLTSGCVRGLAISSTFESKSKYLSVSDGEMTLPSCQFAGDEFRRNKKFIMQITSCLSCRRAMSKM